MLNIELSIKAVFQISAKVIDSISHKVGVVAAFSALVMSLIITYEVFMRYVLRHPTVWVLDVSEYLVVSVVFLGAAWCLHEDGHVFVDLVTDRLTPQARLISRAISSFIAFIFCIILAWQSWLWWWPSYTYGWTSDTALKFPLVAPYLFVAVGFTVLTLQYALKVIQHFCDISKSRR